MLMGKTKDNRTKRKDVRQESSVKNQVQVQAQESSSRAKKKDARNFVFIREIRVSGQ